MLDFTNQFKELEESNDLEILNNKISPKLVNSFEEVLLAPNLEQLKESSLSSLRKKLLLKMNEKIGDLILLFKKKLLSIQEFYEQILRAYTMDTDLYPKLNEDLRNENWVEVDKLSFYAFCLCKAFFHFRLKANLVQESPIQDSSITLYRGTAFDESALSLYDLKTIECFSWNSVTSTSRSEKTAEYFMYQNADLAGKKYPVMFIIEIPLTSGDEAEYLRWIDIHQYSAIPREGEVVLAPGSVFELIKVSTDQDKKTIIKIRLRNEIKSLVYGGMMMQGTLQSQMATEKEAKIMCLEGKELSQALMNIRGNKLIEELEFCLCTFNKKSLSRMFEVLSTLRKAKKLKFISCMYQDNGGIPIERHRQEERCQVTKIEIIEGNSFFQMICNENYNQDYWISLKELDLDFRSNRSLTDKELNCAVFQGLRCLTQLTSLNINCEECSRITDEGVSSLAEGLYSLTQLTHFSLDLEGCRQITNEGVGILMSQGLQSLARSTSLILYFTYCERVTNQDLYLLACKWLKHLISSLIVENNILQNVIIVPVHETFRSSRIRLIRPSSQEEKQNFERTSTSSKPLEECEKLRDENLIETLISKFIENEERIYHTASLGECSQHFFNICKLTSLTFDFQKNRHLITDKFVHNFSSQVLKNLLLLCSLTLNFTECKQITDQGVGDLALHGLKSLTHLVSLKIVFYSCSDITDKGVNDLASEGLAYLSQLKSLTLSFQGYSQVTNEGLISLAWHGLRQLSQLETLNLSPASGAMNKGINGLSQGLKYLTQLKFLILNCFGFEITDQGMNNLILLIVKNLPRLTFLDLNLTCCYSLTHPTLRNIIRVLYYFGFTKELEADDEDE